MLNIRSHVFETNSSSSHCFIYARDLQIPKEIHIESNADMFNTLTMYYNDDPDNFIAWLSRIGVQRIFVDEKLIETIPPLKRIPKMFNSACEAHNEDIDDEEILKYVLFGQMVKRFDEYVDSPSEFAEVKQIQRSNKFVWSDWFV